MTLLCKTLKIVYVWFLFQLLGAAYSDTQTGRRIHLQSETRGLEIIYGADDTLENCSIATNERSANQSYAVTLPTSVIPVSETFMASVTESCKVFQRDLKGSLKPRRKRLIIYPGTKWCGIGNIAKHDFDFGRHVFTDSCCRAHDSCPVSISPFKTYMGLTNLGLFPSSECNCDADFYHCLKSLHEPAAKEIGDIYFNLIRPDCISFAPSLICTSRYWDCVRDEEKQETHRIKASHRHVVKLDYLWNTFRMSCQSGLSIGQANVPDCIQNKLYTYSNVQ